MNLLGLAPLGAGLGQFAQDYRQQQESALRQMAARMQLQQLQREQAARSLVGQVLSAGGIPGFGNQMSAGMQPAAAPAGPPAAAMPPTPPSNAGQPLAQSNIPLSTGGTPTGVMPLDDDPQSLQYAQQSAVRQNVPVLDYDVEREQAPAGPSGGAPAAETPAADAAAQQPQMQLQEAPTWLSMFNHTDPQAIAQRIKQVRPDADPEAIAMATESLYKMASGNWHEQVAAASMMKYLVGDATRRRGQDITQRGQDIRAGTAAAGRDVTMRGQDIRAGTAAAGQAGIQARFDQRRADQAAARAEAKGDKATANALRSMNQRYNELARLVSVIDAGPNPNSSENQAARKKAVAEMQDLAGRIDKRVQQAEKLAPVPTQ